MKIQTIKLDDIYPNEMNPRKIKQNDAGITALARSIEQVGLIQPLMVIQDGGIYRLVAGERRYMAMGSIKDMDDCECLVADDMDDADMMLRLMGDNSLREDFTDVEESRGVQQMLLLGVDPETVSKATGQDEKHVRGASKAREVVSDDAEDMTLDRLFAIAEFADDPEAVERLQDAGEHGWQNVAESLREMRKQRETATAMEARCATLHTAVSHDKFNYAEHNVLQGYISDVKTLEQAIMAACVNHLGTTLTVYITIPTSVWGQTTAHLVTSDPKADDAQTDPDVAERQARTARFTSAMEQGHAGREKFFATQIVKAKSIPHVCAILRKEIDGDWDDGFWGELPLGTQARKWETEQGLSLPHEIPAWLFVAMLAANHGSVELSSYSINRLVSWDAESYHPMMGDYGDYYDWCNAFALDGYETSKDELELLNLIAEIRERVEKEEKEDDDDD